MAEGEIEEPAISTDIAATALGKLAKTVDGVGYALTSLKFPPSSIRGLRGIESYQHVRVIDISNNDVTTLGSLAKLPHLLEVCAANNQITSLASWAGGELKFLHTLDVSKNKIDDLSGFALPKLATANFSDNAITTVNFSGTPELESVSLNNNQLQEFNLQTLAKLKKASATGNQIATLNFRGLSALEDLTLDRNALETMEASWAEVPVLRVLSVSENTIKPDGWAPLRNVPSLRKINFANQKVSEDAEPCEAILEEILIANPRVNFVMEEEDYVEVTEEQRQKAQELQSAREAALLATEGGEDAGEEAVA